MRLWAKLSHLYRNAFYRNRLETDLDDELRNYVDALIARKTAAGMTVDEARRAALAEVGGIEQVKEGCREVRPLAMLESVIGDLAYAVRTLRNSPAFTATAVLSLALGIGANSALFSGVNALLLRTIPIPHPQSFVRLRSAGKNDMRNSSSRYGFSGKTPADEDIFETTSYPVYQALRAANQTLTDIIASAPLGDLNVVVGGKAELSSSLVVSGNYFQVLEVSVEIGRTLTQEDDRPEATPVAVISHGFWQRRFGGQASVIGQTITVNNVPVTIIGVTRQEFTGVYNLTESAPDITMPLALDMQLDPAFDNANLKTGRINDGTWWWLQITGRLKPGVHIEQIKANLAGPFEAAARATFASYLTSITAKERSSSQFQNRTAVPHLLVDSASRGIYEVNTDTLQSAKVLSVVVGLLLAIVCANIANLLLSRAAARQKEITVRLSLGATRARLVRQLLTESFLLSFMGSALGVAVGYSARQLLPFAHSAPIDWRVLGFAALLCVTTGLAFGLIPALRATEGGLSGSMKETSRNISRSRTFLTKSLVVVQVAISVTVLIGAGLFLRTLRNLREVDPGFNPRNLVIFTINPTLNHYDSLRITNLYNGIQREIESLPGVRSISRSNVAPLSGSENTTHMFIQGKPPKGEHGEELWVMRVSPEFFETLGIPLIRGRNLDERDAQPKDPQVCVINETAARQYFPGEDPIGKRWGNSVEQSGDREIVGIVRDIKYRSVRDAAPPTGFMPQHPDAAGNLTFEVRTAGDPALFMQPIRQIVQRVDSNLPIVHMSSEIELAEGQLKQEQFFALSYSLFGGLALLLASIGLFGVMSYNVARRTNEIGIRMALGVERADVLRMILQESLSMVFIGIGVGCVAALAARRLIATMLFGVPPADAISIGAAIGLMLAVSLISGYLPARRAARVDPMVALHYE
jgi:predicted permease